MYRTIFFMLIAVGLSACSTLPENLHSENTNLITSYQEWQQSGFDSEEVRIGGVIASVTNLSDRTRIEIVNLPVDSNGKPNLSVTPEKRFSAYVEGYLEPVALAKGRLITVLGTSHGQEQTKVGDYSMTIPIIQALAFHLWRIEERVIFDQDSPFMFPCWGINCRSIRQSPSSGKVIQEVK
ncbi:Slp family lipoprotein [Vibrio sp. SCSIO 43137]|uniref:Slp family lipoprotein n=1 Tax=Vibrio sp. SCSIO 43137 TaxID=3021011 RepID=UPI00230736EC|nr:Slp family lipoprotein [Vibrio sp. SCSIO 43137]WCE30551.1 Slp family lipoprotein [Vibrio sp. SCSIO 43137]